MSRRAPTYMADFETTVEFQYLVEGCVRVWAWAVEEVDGHQEVHTGETIEEFISFFTGKKATIYFHNMKFDCMFLLDYWMRHGVPRAELDDTSQEEYLHTIIDGHGQMYIVRYVNKLDGTDLTFKDLMKKYRMPLEKIAQIFGIEGKSPLLLGYRPIGREVTDWEWERVINDVRIGAVALRYQMINGLTGLTVASDAIRSYQDFIGMDVYKQRHPNLSYELDQELRRAYRGGEVYVNPKWREKDVFDVLVFDYNSQYPAIMKGTKGEKLPAGMPRRVEPNYQDREDEVSIVDITCTLKLKPGAIPWIHYRGVFGHTSEEFIYIEKSPLRFSFTSVDMELLRRTYDTPIFQINKKFVFHAEEGQFADYIDYQTNLKIEADKAGNGGARQQAKDMMNTPSGRFALNPNAEQKVPYFDPKENRIRFNRVEERRKNAYCPTSCFITAYARNHIITDGMKFGDQLVYIDTDSMHIMQGKIDPFKVLDVDPRALGKLKHEATWKRARYLRPKAYYHDMGPGSNRDPEKGKVEVEIKCGGMPDAVKDFVDYENFFINKEFNGKLMGQVVPGGYLLRDTKYKIKEKEGWRL